MKKLFAILAVLVLFGTYAWAAPAIILWSDDAQNNFQANVFCQPSLTGSNDVGLGNFFINTSFSGSEAITFTLKGGQGANTNPQTFDVDFSESATTGISSYTGSWDWDEDDNVILQGTDCEQTKTFTYTLTAATFIATGQQQVTVKVTATLSNY